MAVLSLLYVHVLQAKESPIPSDSLLTIDLKSGKNVTLGTHVITLDKFFEGKLNYMYNTAYTGHVYVTFFIMQLNILM